MVLERKEEKALNCTHGFFVTVTVTVTCALSDSYRRTALSDWLSLFVPRQ
jgi:hypothetical protein